MCTSPKIPGLNPSLPLPPCAGHVRHRPLAQSLRTTSPGRAPLHRRRRRSIRSPVAATYSSPALCPMSTTSRTWGTSSAVSIPSAVLSPPPILLPRALAYPPFCFSDGFGFGRHLQACSAPTCSRGTVGCEGTTRSTYAASTSTGRPPRPRPWRRSARPRRSATSERALPSRCHFSLILVCLYRIRQSTVMKSIQHCFELPHIQIRTKVSVINL